MKELLRTQDLTVMLYAKTILDGLGITSFEVDVNMSNLYGVLPKRLLVVDHDFEEALDALLANDVNAVFFNGN